MEIPFLLKDKTVLITGASSGIGKSIAIECSKIGAKLYITGRDKEKLSLTHKELQGEYHKMLPFDLSIEDNLIKLVDSLPELDGIVHSAGMTKNIPFQFASKSNMQEVFDINFFAPSELTRLLLKNRKINRHSSIIFISSISGVYCSAPASSIYSASKGAINGLVKGLSLDLAPKGIRVNSINPGVIETSIFQSGVITEEQLIEDQKKYPLKRFGKPEEIAYAAIYLLSDASKWTTGSNMVIDGGFTLL